MTAVSSGIGKLTFVMGSKKDNVDARLALIERKKREHWMIRAPGRDSNEVMAALHTLQE